MRHICRICFILFLFPIVVFAQDEVEIWNFGYVFGEGHLVSFSTSGESHNLMTGETIRNNDPGTRLNNEQILVDLFVDGNNGLYRLTPELAVLVDDSPNRPIFPLVTIDGVAVMAGAPSDQPIPGFLFTADDVRQLPHLVEGYRLSIRFSEDQASLRYLGADENGQWVLYDYDVATGEDKLIFDFGSSHPQVRPDKWGNFWLWRVESDGQAEYRMVTLDGEVEMLGTFDESLISGAIYVTGSKVVIYPETCGDDSCPVTVRGSDGEVVFQGGTDVFRALPIDHAPDGRLIVINRHDEFYLLSVDSPPKFVGYYHNEPQRDVFPSRFLANSPDGRWLYVVDDDTTPTKYQVVDVLNGEIMAEFPFSRNNPLDAIFYADGLAYFSINLLEDTAIFYEDLLAEAEVVTIDEGAPVMMLSDETAIFNTRENMIIHNFATGDDRVILEGYYLAMRIYRLDLR